MIYLFIVASIIILAFLLFYLYFKKRRVRAEQDEDLVWIELINNFKSMAPQIKDMKQLENYLSNINEQVKNHETDYTFLEAFNSIIKQTRERLKQDA